MRIVAHESGWALADGPCGRRWLRETDIARRGLIVAYGRWTRIAKVNGRWQTCDDGGPRR